MGLKLREEKKGRERAIGTPFTGDQKRKKKKRGGKKKVFSYSTSASDIAREGEGEEPPCRSIELTIVREKGEEEKQQLRLGRPAQGTERKRGISFPYPLCPGKKKGKKKGKSWEFSGESQHCTIGGGRKRGSTLPHKKGRGSRESHSDNL